MGNVKENKVRKKPFSGQILEMKPISSEKNVAKKFH